MKTTHLGFSGRSPMLGFLNGSILCLSCFGMADILVAVVSLLLLFVKIISSVFIPCV